MTKKQLEERIEALERELSDLKSQMLALALRPPVVSICVPPVIPAPLPAPYVSPTWPTIICTQNPAALTVQ
jgi:hypothetical protein